MTPTFRHALHSLLLALLCTSVGAQTPQPPSLVKVDIEAQQLDKALNAWAKQTGFSIMIPVERAAQGRMAPKVAGSYTPEQALQLLLSASDLRYEFVDARTVAIRAPKPAASQSAQPAASTSLPSSGESGTAADPVRLAQADQPSPSEGEGQGEDGDKKDTNVKEIRGIPEILVKGSRGGSLNVDIARSEDDVQPYVVLSREEIARTGATDLQELLEQKIGAATRQGSPTQTAFSNLGNSSLIDLRGLGADETLILINGRRAPSTGIGGTFFQPDLNGIPLSSIERIEVLPSTASGIFGGGATGGVINVVLKQDYQGLEASVSYGNAFSAGSYTRQVSLSGGTSLENGKTSLMFSGSHSEEEGLRAGDRGYLVSARELALQNNPSGLLNSAVPPLGATANIRSADSIFVPVPAGTPGSIGGLPIGTFIPGFTSAPNTAENPNFLAQTAPLVLKNGTPLNSTITHIPSGYPGAAVDGGAALAANAGSYNLDLAGTAQPQGAKSLLLKAPTVTSLFTSVHRRFGDSLVAFVEGAFSRNESSMLANNASSSVFLPPNSALNPFNQAIAVEVPVVGFDREAKTRIDGRRIVGGLVVSLAADWHLESEYSWSSSEIESRQAEKLLDTTFSETEVDPLRDLNTFPVDLSPYSVQGTFVTPYKSTISNPSVRVGGTLPISLLGENRPSLTAALEYRREELDEASLIQASSVSFLYPSRNQSVASAYLESRIPLVSTLNSRAGINSLEIQLALRTDRYKTVAANTINLSAQTPDDVLRESARLSSIDPTVGVRYEPVNGLMLRASYATGFLPPNVSQLVPSAPTLFTATGANGWVDRLRGNEPVIGTFTNVSGGNPDLLPEDAKSWTAGLVLQPSILPHFRLSLDWTKIRKRNNIANLFISQQLIDNSIYVPGLVTRAEATPQNDPTGFGVGPITGFSQQLLNFAKLDVTAYDLSSSYRWDTSRFGSIALSSRATRLVHNRAQLIPTLDAVENAGSFGYLKWNAAAELAWTFKSWSAGWAAQYYDGYWLTPDHLPDASQGSASIGSQIYHDLSIQWNKATGGGGVGDRLLSGITVQLAIKNIMNASPPIVVNAEGGYSYLGDPRRARYVLSLQKQF